MTLNTSRIVDVALEATVVGSFSKLGYELRSRLENWTPLSAYDMVGKTVVVTGPTSGLGREVAVTLKSINANLVLVARNQEKLHALIDELRSRPGVGTVLGYVADMGSISAVRSAATLIAHEHPKIDVLIHNAGALPQQRKLTGDNLEETVASHVVGPFVMTSLLLPQLREGKGRVITVSSGGMYAASLPHLGQGGSLEMRAEKFDGVKQYAIAKRAQATLNEIWAQKESSIQFHCMHPGWSDTPGVQESLPKFRNLAKLVLRDVQQGADTICWLAAEPNLPEKSGTFWCDRSARSLHRLPNTKRSDSTSARDALWTWCQQFVSAAGSAGNS